MADGIRSANYDSINVSTGYFFNFEGYRKEPEIYRSFPDLLDLGTAVIGERFYGQKVLQRTNLDGFSFDFIPNAPSRPLTVVAGGPTRNISIEVKSEFNSDVLYGIGQAGVESGEGAGEGAIAIQFDEDVCQIGFITLLETPNIPADIRSSFGKLNITFYSRDAEIIDTIAIAQGLEIIELGFEQTSSVRPLIAGILIQNFDRGGVPIEDLKVSRDCNFQIS